MHACTHFSSTLLLTIHMKCLLIVPCVKLLGPNTDTHTLWAVNVTGHFVAPTNRPKNLQLQIKIISLVRLPPCYGLMDLNLIFELVMGV